MLTTTAPHPERLADAERALIRRSHYGSDDDDLDPEALRAACERAARLADWPHLPDADFRESGLIPLLNAQHLQGPGPLPGRPNPDGEAVAEHGLAGAIFRWAVAEHSETGHAPERSSILRTALSFRTAHIAYRKPAEPNHELPE